MRVVNLATILEAASRIRPYLVRTPCLVNPLVDEALGVRMFAKSEHLQVTGSFKARGAFNVVMALDDDVARRGVVAHSTGNHGAALACAAKERGVDCAIVVPTTTPQAKKDNIARFGARLVDCAPSPKARSEAALETAAEMGGATIVPPFDDVDVISGQGTIGLELMQDHPDLDYILVPVSGGGMLAGIAAAVAEMSPSTKVVAVEPQGKRLQESLESQRRVVFTEEELKEQPTLKTAADAMPTRLLGPAHVWPIVSKNVQHVLTVDDDDIARAVTFTLKELKQVVEPAGAVALAAILNGAFQRIIIDPASFKRPPPKVAIVVCGGNVDSSTLAKHLY